MIPISFVWWNRFSGQILWWFYAVWLPLNSDHVSCWVTQVSIRFEHHSSSCRVHWTGVQCAQLDGVLLLAFVFTFLCGSSLRTKPILSPLDIPNRTGDLVGPLHTAVWTFHFHLLLLDYIWHLIMDGSYLSKDLCDSLKVANNVILLKKSTQRRAFLQTLL
jgi:hypothetical protein